VLLASFPSPSRAVWDLGPIPIRAYALCIIAGIIAAIWIAERRWVARGGKRGTVSDIAVWAVIFGLIGGRLYHVITDNELYFRAGRDPWRAFYVWEGGLGVWGAIALGGVGAWIGCRRRGIKLPPFADAAAPGIAVAQGIGRLGNYFNQELFGRPSDLPWAVRIDPDRPSTVPGATAYQPTFLYELLWDFGLAGVLIWADRRYKMGRGRVFALYVMGYTAGRVWIEMLRIDTANHILGLRLNVWTSIIVFAGGLIYFLLHPGPRETVVEPDLTPATDTPAGAAAAPAGETSGDATNGSDEDAPADDTEAKADAGAPPTEAEPATADGGNADAKADAGAAPAEAEAAPADEPDPPDDPGAAERPDSAEPAERAETAEPADTAETTEPAETAETTEPAETAETTERAENGERAETDSDDESVDADSGAADGVPAGRRKR
jgi:phosphatidylglycerol---prolipoprotein diacylglyceryl transferase